MEGLRIPVSAVAALSELGRTERGDAREYVEPFGLTDDDVPTLVEPGEALGHVGTHPRLAKVRT